MYQTAVLVILQSWFGVAPLGRVHMQWQIPSWHTLVKKRTVNHYDVEYAICAYMYPPTILAQSWANRDRSCVNNCKGCDDERNDVEHMHTIGS